MKNNSLSVKKPGILLIPEGGMSWGLRKQVLENGFQEAGKTYQLKVYSP
jgi:hypothetical protein